MSTSPSTDRILPVRTRLPRVPFVWFPLLTVPGLAVSYVEFCSGAPLTFTLRKFVADPALIGFLISINVAFNFLVSPVSAYLGDRVWTRFGRRRVFLMAGWSGLVLCLLALPLMPNIWALAGVIILYQFFQDAASAHLQPLNYEIVPPTQRGRFQMVNSIVGSLFGIFMNLVILAQFDSSHRVSFDLGWLGTWEGMITGEQTVYWFGALLVSGIVVYLGLFVRETRPPPVLVETKGLSPRTFLEDTYGSRQFRPIYVLCVGVCITVAGMATTQTLMLVEQFRFAKADLGQLGVIRDVSNLVVFVPLLGFLVDRLPRFYLTLAGLVGVALTNLAYFLYLKIAAPGGVPPFEAVAAMTVFLAFFNSCWSMSHAPNCFDYVPSHRFGTYLSGQNLLIGVLLFLLPNAYGLWVKGYSALFCEPGVYDYSSAYILQAVLSAGGVSLALYFWRCVKRGDITRKGADEVRESPAG